MSKRLKDKVALVTGASRGIGFSIALALAREGAHVYGVARTIGALEELYDTIMSEGGIATMVPMDLTEFNGIDHLGESIFNQHKKLDVLVGNAGILGQLAPVGHIDPETWDEIFKINVTANWRLIRSFDQLLRNSTAGRGVFLSSSVARSCKPFWGGYSASKAALEAIVKTYALEVEKISNVKINLVDPGPIRTSMRAKAMPGEDPKILSSPESLSLGIIDLMLPECISTGNLFDFPTKRMIDLANTVDKL